MFLGIPRDVLYAALAGACAGLAQRPRGDWESFVDIPDKAGTRYYALLIFKGLWEAFKLAGNAVVCAWLAQLLQHFPLVDGAAKLAPLALAGVLAWGSAKWLPALSDYVLGRMKKGKDAPETPK